jgi:hypothetical protein
MHIKIMHMKKILFATMLVATSICTFAQKQNTVAITAANIESTLNGSWKIARVSPSDKQVSIQSFVLKGAGYGEITKSIDKGLVKTVFSKIYGINQNAIIFADAEGVRVVYKIIELQKNLIRLSDGEATIDYVKE